MRAGLTDLHSWQASFGSLDLQSTMVGHGNTLARLGLELALEDGRPAVVFEWSERARSLASRVTSLRPPPDPELAADLTALRLLDPSETAKARELRERIRSKTWYAAEDGSVDEPASPRGPPDTAPQGPGRAGRAHRARRRGHRTGRDR